MAAADIVEIAVVKQQPFSGLPSLALDDHIILILLGSASTYKWFEPRRRIISRGSMIVRDV